MHQIIIAKNTPHKKTIKNQLLYIDIFMHNYSKVFSLFPNAKEITESVGILECLYHKIKVDRSSISTVCYVLGDGTTPKTGAIVAISSKFQVHSIDPKIKVKQSVYIPRLFISKCKSQNFKAIDQTATLSIILAVHSHANLNDFWQRIPLSKIAIAIPCCVNQCTDIDPVESYNDNKIFSEKNQIIYWISKPVIPI